MHRTGFVQYLTDRGITGEAAEHQVAAAERLDAACGDAPPTADTMRAHVDRLAASGADTIDELVALARYARFSQHEDAFAFVLELLDGYEAFANLHARLGDVAGTETRDRIFKGVSIPTPGTCTMDRSRINRTVMERVLDQLSSEQVELLLSDCLRDLDESGYDPERQRYQEMGSVDAYLADKRARFLDEMEEHRATGKRYFNQRITQAVVDYVRSEPEIGAGRREGSVIYITKIPYAADDYLKATDPRRKRFLFCHCPWARQSLAVTETPVPSTFCRCSAGFTKKPWEVIFGHRLRADVLESVLAGDDKCRFAVHLPADVLEEGK